MSILIRTTVLFCLLLLQISCSKDSDHQDDPANDVPGVFTAKLNGEDWTSTDRGATLYSRENTLVLGGGDYRTRVSVGIFIDPSNPLGSYDLVPNGHNSVFVDPSSEYYTSDQNHPEAGGRLTITKFDTVTHQLSGTLRFKSFSKDNTKSIAGESGTFTDIYLGVDTGTYKPNHAVYDIEGVTATHVATNKVDARISCNTNGSIETLEVKIRCALETYNRSLKFLIPLASTPGTYAIQPDQAPYFYCGENFITSRYELYDYENPYHLLNGTMIITEIDRAARKIRASFQLTMKDSSALYNSISISSGTLELNDWKPYGTP